MLNESEYRCALLLWVVPGGTAVLPSTALMLAVPAQIARCEIVVLATPPGKHGSICKDVFYCAKKADPKLYVEKILDLEIHVTAAKMIVRVFL
ncbi:hypothetical protein MKW94_015273 [Papaver nudicaule]|uniref:Uncharacterized protein n=1 Tax=Papaver nudicaule TaxID=74823 RepID=A0AA41UZI0_PAPNU|nr:hypothetical protein [Papaver nudicaule]